MKGIITLERMEIAALGKVRTLEQCSLAHFAQIHIPIQHALHSGMYHRTAIVPAGVLMTGALIKIPTLLIVHGHCKVSTGKCTLDLNGYNVLEACRYRKQAFLAITETHITMVFPTSAKTVEEAEKEFTDESDSLQSRLNSNEGNNSCQEQSLLPPSQPLPQELP